MDGVTNLIREFSSNFNDIKEWKYTVEMYEEGIVIKEFNQDCNGNLKEINSINISNACAELLFRTIARDFENRAFDSNL